MDPFLLYTCWRILCTAQSPWQEENMFSLSSKLGIQHFHQSSMQLRYIQSKISRDQKPTKKMVCYSAWKSTYNKLYGIHLRVVTRLTWYIFCKRYFLVPHTFPGFHYQWGTIFSFTNNFTWIHMKILVGAMTNIKSTYEVERNWHGDPCAPQAYSWEGLNCSYEDYNPPRIISL